MFVKLQGLLISWVLNNLGTILFLAWLLSVLLTAFLSAFAAHVLTRDAQSRARVVELREQLREERRRHANEELAMLRKLGTYRDAALRNTVSTLLSGR